MLHKGHIKTGGGAESLLHKGHIETGGGAESLLHKGHIKLANWIWNLLCSFTAVYGLYESSRRMATCQLKATSSVNMLGMLSWQLTDHVCYVAGG